MLKIIADDSSLVPPHAELKYQGQLFSTYQWDQEMFDGTNETFEMIKRTDTVNVIGISEGKIIVITDEQPHFGSRVSFPGGRVDASDRSTLEAAQREMLEETGYQFGNWRLIKVRQPYRKIEWFVYTYLAWDGHKNTQPNPDPGEIISSKLLSFHEVKNMCQNDTGYLADSKELFSSTDSLDELLAAPEFIGQQIDR